MIQQIFNWSDFLFVWIYFSATLKFSISKSQMTLDESSEISNMSSEDTTTFLETPEQQQQQQQQHHEQQLTNTNKMLSIKRAPIVQMSSIYCYSDSTTSLATTAPTPSAKLKTSHSSIEPLSPSANVSSAKATPQPFATDTAPNIVISRHR